MESSLSHGECAGAHTETNTSGPEMAAVASSAVNFAIGRVVLIGRVQGTATISTAKAPFVEHPTLADHLLGSEDGVSTPLATLSGSGAWAAVGARVMDDWGDTIGAH